MKSVSDSDLLVSQMSMGIETIIDKRVPLDPDAIPASQNPIKRQVMVISFSPIVEFFQLVIQNKVMPKTAVENGIGLPENISNLPRKRCVRSNLYAKLFEKIKYTKNVVATAIFAYFSSLCALMLNPSFEVSNIAKPTIGIGNIGLNEVMENQISFWNIARIINTKKIEERARYNIFDDELIEKLFLELNK